MPAVHRSDGHYRSLITDNFGLDCRNYICRNVIHIKSIHNIHTRIVHTEVFHILIFRMNRMKSHTPIHKQLEGVFVLKFFFETLKSHNVSFVRKSPSPVAT